MDASGGKQWSKRHDWAVCREPYKKQLDELGTKWIEGTLSNEALAFEAVKLLDQVEWIQQPSKSLEVVPMDDVISQIKILTKTMLAGASHQNVTPEHRREALDYTCVQSKRGYQGTR